MRCMRSSLYVQWPQINLSVRVCSVRQKGPVGSADSLLNQAPAAQTRDTRGVEPFLPSRFRIVLRNEARNPPAQFGGTGLRQPAQDTHRGVIHSRKRPEIASESL